MEVEDDKKWRGTAMVRVAGKTADQTWSLLQDFSGLHKFIETLTCEYASGNPNTLGCVRYCSTTVIEPNGSQQIWWSKEKLLSFDPTNRSYSYKIIENNMGFGQYEASMKVLSTFQDCEEGDSFIEWTFVAEPVEGKSEEGIRSWLQRFAETISEKMSTMAA